MTQDLKRSRKISKYQMIITFTIVTKGLRAAFYDSAVQSLISPLFFVKMAVHKDAHKLLCNDAGLNTTT